MKTLLALAALCCLAKQSTAQELLVGNYTSGTIVRFDLASGKNLGTYSGGSLSGVLQMALGPDGLLYVCSEKNNQIERFNPRTHEFVDIFVDKVGLKSPTGILFDRSGRMLVSNFDSHSLSRYDATGKYLGDFIPQGTGGLKGPDIGIIFGPDHMLYVPSFETHSVLRFDAATGKFLDTFIAPEAGGLAHPRTILFRDKKVWVSDERHSQVLRFDLHGKYVDTVIAKNANGLNGAAGMVFDDKGALYICSWRNNGVIKFDPKTGALTDFATEGLGGPVTLLIVPQPTGR